MKPKILLLGKNGQLGWELQKVLPSLGKVVALGRGELDFIDFDRIRVIVREIRPDLIVNAAAYTAVDRAEAQQELATAVNSEAPRILAEEAARSNAALLHFSTDYIFDGQKREPYNELDTPNPLSAYGESKWKGERLIQAVGAPHLILRTSWMYGMRGSNFYTTINQLSKEDKEIRVVDDQVGSPTWSRAVAEATVEIIDLKKRGTDGDFASYFTEHSGICHYAASGSTTSLGFATEILRERRSNDSGIAQLEPIASAEYGALANRPPYSVLASSRAQTEFGLSIPNWREQLDQMQEEMLSDEQRDVPPDRDLA